MSEMSEMSEQKIDLNWMISNYLDKAYKDQPDNKPEEKDTFKLTSCEKNKDNAEQMDCNISAKASDDSPPRTLNQLIAKAFSGDHTQWGPQVSTNKAFSKKLDRMMDTLNIWEYGDSIANELDVENTVFSRLLTDTIKTEKNIKHNSAYTPSFCRDHASSINSFSGVRMF